MGSSRCESHKMLPMVTYRRPRLQRYRNFEDPGKISVERSKATGVQPLRAKVSKRALGCASGGGSARSQRSSARATSIHCQIELAPPCSRAHLLNIRAPPAPRAPLRAGECQDKPWYRRLQNGGLSFCPFGSSQVAGSTLIT
jgi:hypothetical protein